MDLVVLAGAMGVEPRWTRGCPRPLLPLGGAALLETLLTGFDAFADGHSAVCANGHTELISQRIATRRGRRPVILVEDSVPRGVAGCLRGCAPLTQSSTVFLASGSVYLDDDPAWMLAAHRSAGNALTVFCTEDRDAGGAKTLRPSGVYCFERDAVEHIRPTGYQDLKEQWVPALREAGLRVGAVTLPGTTREVRDWATYLRTVTHFLTHRRPGPQGSTTLASDVCRAENVIVGPRARIVGPVFLGEGCEVESDAVIIGPAVLGAGCRVESGAFLTRVTTSSAVRFPRGRRVSDRFFPGPFDLPVHGGSAGGTVDRSLRSGTALQPGLRVLPMESLGRPSTWGAAAV